MKNYIIYLLGGYTEQYVSQLQESYSKLLEENIDLNEELNKYERPRDPATGRFISRK